MKYFLALVLSIVSINTYSTTCWSEFIDEEFARAQGLSVVESVVKRSPIIFVGTASIVKKTIVEEQGEDPIVLDFQALFEVEESLKGDTSNQVKIESGNICPCRYDFKSGIKYLVFATERNGSMYVYNCKYVSPVEASKLAEVRNAVRVNKAGQ